MRVGPGPRWAKSRFRARAQDPTAQATEASIDAAFAGVTVIDDRRDHAVTRSKVTIFLFIVVVFAYLSAQVQD